jgi:uncharacterized protein YjiS (DUF1127 family)
MTMTTNTNDFKTDEASAILSGSRTFRVLRSAWRTVHGSGRPVSSYLRALRHILYSLDDRALKDMGIYQGEIDAILQERIPPRRAGWLSRPLSGGFS